MFVFFQKKLDHFLNKVDTAVVISDQAQAAYAHIDDSLEDALAVLEGLPPAVILKIKQAGYYDQYEAALATINATITAVSAAEEDAAHMKKELDEVSHITHKVDDFVSEWCQDFVYCWQRASFAGLAVAFLSIVESIKAFERLDNRLRAGHLRESGVWDSWRLSKYEKQIRSADRVGVLEYLSSPFSSFWLFFKVLNTARPQVHGLPALNSCSRLDDGHHTVLHGRHVLLQRPHSALPLAHSISE